MLKVFAFQNRIKYFVYCKAGLKAKCKKLFVNLKAGNSLFKESSLFLDDQT